MKGRIGAILMIVFGAAAVIYALFIYHYQPGDPYSRSLWARICGVLGAGIAVKGIFRLFGWGKKDKTGAGTADSEK